jgi:toxin ParE1/3/4
MGSSNGGEAAADSYYNALFDRFEEIAARPYSYPAVEHIRKGYRRSVCGLDSIYYRVADDGTVEIMAITLQGKRMDRLMWIAGIAS